jgi:hypothetical protein
LVTVRVIALESIRMNFNLVYAKLFIGVAKVVTFLAKPSTIIGGFVWNYLHV